MVYALAKAASDRGVTVVAVNRPLCPFSTVFRKRNRVGELFGPPLLEKLDSNLYLYNPKYIIHDDIANRWSFFERANIAALRRSYVHLQKRLGIIEPNPIIWYNYPHQAYVTRLLGGSFHIFELYDNLSDFNGIESDFVNRLEARYRPNVDLLLTTSHPLHRRYSVSYRRAYMFGNGLSGEMYRALVEQHIAGRSEIKQIPSPRLGYAGMISARLDWTLIQLLAEAEPNWNFIFAGPVDDRKIWQSLQRYSNIHLPGKFDRKQLPAVLKAFDIGILPYRDNAFFHALNPLKFYEMAAAGLHMVASNIEELKSFPQDLVRIRPNEPEIWKETISNLIREGNGQASMIGPDVASRFIWEDMTSALLDRLAGEWMSDR